MANMRHVTLGGSALGIVILLAGCGSDAETAKVAATGVATSAAIASGDPEESATPAQSQAPEQSPAAEAPVDENASANLPDACASLTPADIESATGMKVGDGLAEADRQTDFCALCEWIQVDGRSFVAVAIAPGYPRSL